MSDKKKELEQRKELHRKIWAVADDVRGAVDGWDFKQYILGMLFYRFISENMSEYFNTAEHEAGDPDFDYAKIDDDEAKKDFRPNTVEEKGFFILPSQLFENVVKNAKTNPNLNTELAEIFSYIEGSAVGTAAEGNYTIIMKQEEISQKPSDCNRKEDTPSNLYSKSVFKDNRRKGFAYMSSPT